MTVSKELRELFEIARNNAARLFREEGEVVTMWHAVPREGPHMLIATPWSDDDEKDEAIAFLRDKFRELCIQRFAFITEAWVVEGTRSLSGPQPSRHPDRREVLRIMCEDRNGETLSGHFYILRPEQSPAVLSPFHQDKAGVTFGGRMAGMLVTEH